jgi:hypothetical protein
MTTETTEHDVTMAAELAKATAATAGEIAAAAVLSESARARLGAGDLAPGTYLAALLNAGKLIDAITFLAHALPKREGAWWACQAARTRPLGDESALARKVVRAAEAWVFAPSDDKRRLAMALAEELGFRTAAAWTGAAVFWAGDSLAPPDQPKVPPAPELSCRAVAGAVMLAAAEGPAERIAEAQRALVDVGVDIANGGTGRRAEDPA